MSADSRPETRLREPMTFSHAGDLANQVSRLFHAPRERVFRFFTDRETAPNLWAPDPKLVKVETYEFRPGGKYSFRVQQPEGPPIHYFGEYREIEVPRRVVNTMEVDSLPGVVALETDEFLEVGSFTRVAVVWRFDRQEDRDRMGGPKIEAIVRAMWDHVADLLGSP